MVRQTSRDRKAKAIRILKESELSYVVGMLNNPSPERATAQRLLRIIMEREQLRRTLPPFSAGTQNEADRYYRSLPKSWFDLTRLINDFLTHHPAVLQVGDFPDCALELDWEPIYARTEAKVEEFDSLIGFLRDLELGNLERVRHCECGKYFVARSTLSRFCSSECRVRFWESSEARRQQKRLRAKELYRLHKSGKVK